MIRASFRLAGDEVCGLSLAGHAQAGPYGHDLVCAAVSALAIATANSFLRLKLPVSVEQEEEGALEIRQHGPMDRIQAIQAQLLWDHLYHALRDIATAYGTRYLSIQIIRLEEVGICST